MSTAGAVVHLTRLGATWQSHGDRAGSGVLTGVCAGSLNLLAGWTPRHLRGLGAEVHRASKAYRQESLSVFVGPESQSGRRGRETPGSG